MKAMKMLLGALVALMVLGGMAMAVPTTSVTATIDPTITVTAPPNIADWKLAIADAENNVQSTTAGVASNGKWALNINTKGIAGVEDYHGRFWSAQARTDGLGFEIAPDKGFMGNKMEVDSGSISDMPLDDGPQLLATGTLSASVPVDLEQKVTIDDPAETDYKIVLEFTGTIT